MEDLSGRELGPYRVLAPLGEGGMAAVFRAYQPSMDRDVALKVLPRHLAGDPQFTARFENEARLLARLQHPHILPVFDFGQAGGYAYIVMPLVEAGTLAQLLRGQPLPTWQICSVGAQIARALDYAHGRGLLHRDVKPNNVLIDETGNCLLTDFGIAKLVEGAAKFTATGMLVGTPAYMSPEQGRGASLDRRSDIYSLGIILYELATGRVPFSAETPVAVIYKHAHDPLPPVERLNPRLPPALVRILYKALAKNPEDRFATAGEMANALEACRAALGWDKTEVEPIPAPLPKPAPAPGPTPPPRTPPPSQGPAPKPRLALAGFGGVALLASVLGLLGVCGMLAVLPRLFGTMASPDASPTAVHTRPAVGGTRTPAPAVTASPAPPTATRTAAPTSTRLAPTATRTPASTATSSLPGPAPRLMFRDDFQSTSSGWETSRTSSRVLGYGNGVYVFEIFESGIRPHTLAPAGEITNAQIAVTVRSLKAGTVPWLGVVCNRQASGAYYYLGFRPDGYYSISYFDGEDRHVLTSERDALELSDAIQKNAEAYRLEAECGSNGRLRLVVDGAEIAAAGDITHTSGEVGLSAASYADVPVEVHFDDLVVRGAPPPVVLLRDDFEDATSGWDSSSSEQRSVAYRDGRYVIEIHTPKLRVWGSQRAETLSNVRVAVTVRDAGATGTGRFGVVCHRQSSGAHYFLGVDGEGDYIIGFFDGEASEQLRGGRYARLGAADTRRVEAECAADGTLRLLVDGVQIASAAHDTYTSGQIGLFASSDEEVPVEIHFDDLLVTELE